MEKKRYFNDNIGPNDMISEQLLLPDDADYQALNLNGKK